MKPTPTTCTPPRRTAAYLLTAWALFWLPSTTAAQHEGPTTNDPADASDVSRPSGAPSSTPSESDQRPDASGSIEHVASGPGGGRPPSRAADSLGGTDPSLGSPPDTGSELGTLLLETFVVLIAVCLLAYAILRWGLGRLFGANESGGDAIDILARQPIGTDKSILVVRIGPRTLIVAESDAGISRLGELDAEEASELADEEETDERRSFASYLDQWKGESA